ncbi:MAG: acyl carrier protein [Tissierellia bacterium]|nr:acyl carrier protein [Tissierellia bacterium]
MLKQALEIIAQQFNLDPENLDRDLDFRDDLNADSIELFELFMSLEDELELEVDADDVENFRTIGDVIDYIEDLED